MSAAPQAVMAKILRLCFHIVQRPDESPAFAFSHIEISFFLAGFPD
jgi:hypothetical protein